MVLYFFHSRDYEDKERYIVAKQFGISSNFHSLSMESN